MGQSWDDFWDTPRILLRIGGLFTPDFNSTQFHKQIFWGGLGLSFFVALDKLPLVC